MGVLSIISTVLSLATGALPALIKDGFSLWNTFHTSSGTGENAAAILAQTMAEDAVKAGGGVVGLIREVANGLQAAYPAMHPAHAHSLAAMAVHVADHKASATKTS